MIPVIFFIFLLIKPGGDFSGMEDPDYNVSNIPDSLKTGSHAVIREDRVSLEISSITSARLHRKIAVTIFNENADDLGTLVLQYDKSRKINNLSGKAYNAKGEQILKLKSSDILDHSAPGGSLYDDDRIRYARMVPVNYPCTIEFEYDITYNSLLPIPPWMPWHDENTALEKAVYSIRVPEDLNMRYKELNMPERATVNKVNKSREYLWELSGLKAVQFEPNMPSLDNIFPVVYIACDDFEFDGAKGNMSTWKDFGEWSYKLNEGRDSLSSATIDKVKSMVDSVTDRKTKIKKIYEYLQTNTRYISIQLGIGGFQTFDASFVENHGYGDCKALSNYMHALLKAAGIASYCVLVKSGNNSEDIMIDFPSQQFNHVILCVPGKEDTVWLECTDQHLPFNYLGGFTCDRHVLMITENGGILTRTPVYTKDMNRQIRSGTVTLSPDGKTSAVIETGSSGRQYDPVHLLMYADQDSQKKWLYNQIDIPDFNINHFSFEEGNGSIPVMHEFLDLTLNRYVTTSGKRLFFQPNLMSRMLITSGIKESRSYDLQFNFPYIDRDSITFVLPDGYHVEFIPKEVSIESRFGRYAFRILNQENRIIYLRRMEWNKGRYPREFYPEYRDFVKKINTSDKIKIVLVKST